MTTKTFTLAVLDDQVDAIGLASDFVEMLLYSNPTDPVYRMMKTTIEQVYDPEEMGQEELIEVAAHRAVTHSLGGWYRHDPELIHLVSTEKIQGFKLVPVQTTQYMVFENDDGSETVFTDSDFIALPCSESTQSERVYIWLK